MTPNFPTKPSTVLVFSTKYSYWLSNGIGLIKLLTLLFVAITGLVVLGGHTRVPDPGLNFRQPFEGNITPYGATTALYRIVFSYSGYENAFNVVNEVKVRERAAWNTTPLDTPIANRTVRIPSRRSRRMDSSPSCLLPFCTSLPILRILQQVSQIFLSPFPPPFSPKPDDTHLLTFPHPRSPKSRVTKRKADCSSTLLHPRIWGRRRRQRPQHPHRAQCVWQLARCATRHISHDS